MRKCPRCEQTKDIMEFRMRINGRQKGQTYAYCNICEKELRCIRSQEETRNRTNEERDRENVTRNIRNHVRGICKPMNENRKCAQWLGIVVAEKVLSGYFRDVERMRNCNNGFDFICNRGMKIDVKSACVHVMNGKTRLMFQITRNKTADMFLCVGFDNRENLTPIGIWLIPSKELCDKTCFTLSLSEQGRRKWQKYERDLSKLVNYCNTLNRDDKGYIDEAAK